MNGSPSRAFGLPVLLLVGIAALLVGLVLGTGAGAAGTVLLLGLRNAGQGESPARSAAAALPEELNELKDFVSSTRELDFQRDVPVQVLPDGEFLQALIAAPAVGGELPEHLSATLASLGLSDSADLVDQSLGGAGAAYVDGFYDPASAQIYVKGADWTPRVELTVVHELVHALQDQHFDLQALASQLHSDDESGLAFGAVVEGDATWVEELYASEQTDEWNEELYASYDADFSNLDPLEPVAEALTGLPYSLGWTFASDLQAIGGNEAVNRALRVPPTTLEQVWDADAWFQGKDEVADAEAVPAPPAPDGLRALDEGTLGSHLLAMLGLTQDEYFDLEDGPLAGWAGDRYVTWDETDRSCTRVDVAFDSPDDVSVALERLETWVDDGGLATPAQQHLTLERCTG